ncbi:MAG TPA: hypothetical protein VKH19_19555 [Gemmatimonadaceae bacterium]|nr:hypothetical protein [Gemmatimonadaceae bacterium]
MTMRFLASAAVGLATWACVSAGIARSAADARPIVILVHGRGQFGQDTAALRRDWTADIDSALSKAGVPALPSSDVRLAWYADALDPDSSYSCAPRVRMTGANEELDIRDIASGFLNFLAGAVGEDSREMRGFVGETMYVLDSQSRCAAEARVGKVIRAAAAEHRPVVVVAYSLGSLVTYGYLLSADSLANIRLVTVGSPLALRPVREIIFGEQAGTLRVPKSVLSWENVYDASDVLAGPLSGQLPEGVLRDRPTHASSAEEAHAIARYFRDQATGEALRDAICAAAPQYGSCPR